MIPNVTKGERMAGLLVSLAGPGRANEHTDPHLVAGSAPIMAWHSDDQLNRDAALSIAHQLDQAKDVLGAVVRGHVWHCSLSLRAGEGELPDQMWAEIAHEFMDRMGFTWASGKAPVSWVAVRHGRSTVGNDHIHIAASMVREDGTKWSPHLDFERARQTAPQRRTVSPGRIAGAHGRPPWAAPPRRRSCCASWRRRRGPQGGRWGGLSAAVPLTCLAYQPGWWQGHVAFPVAQTVGAPRGHRSMGPAAQHLPAPGPGSGDTRVVVTPHSGIAGGCAALRIGA